MKRSRRHTFHRTERLKSRKLIGQLFKDGQAVKAFPLRIIWKEVPVKPTSSPIQFTVSVPRRRFKRAVDRNRLKRQIREAYRLRKEALYQQLPEGKGFVMMVLFIGPEKVAYRNIERVMDKGLQKWISLLQEGPTEDKKITSL